MKLLFFGDIVGRAGRQALAKILPDWKAAYQPDLVIANVDNLAHGKGVTPRTLQEIMSLGVDVCTGGDHIFDAPAVNELLDKEQIPLLRPLNYQTPKPGRGSWRFRVGSREILIVHLLGQVFMPEAVRSPFQVIDDCLRLEKSVVPPVAVIVDFHAEATSEKIALGWHLAGRVTAVLGTHTHVTTADERILPGGTAYLTDVGMVGAVNGVIGVKKEGSLRRFLTNELTHLEPLETGLVEVSAVLVEFSSADGQARSIERLRAQVEVL